MGQDAGMTTSTRSRFRTTLDGDETVFAPLCLDPLNARMVEGLGFGAGYLSGGALGRRSRGSGVRRERFRW